MRLLKTIFLPRAKRYWRRKLQDQVDGQIRRIIQVSQVDLETAQSMVDPVEEISVLRHATTDLEKNIEFRIKRVIVHYRSNEQTECLRETLLILAHICRIIGWHDSGRYLETQESELYLLNQEAETA